MKSQQGTPGPSCCRSGHCVCGAKYWKTLIPNPLVYVNFGRSQRILGDAFPCALLRFHTIHPPSSSPQVLRFVEFPAATARRRGEEAQARHCDASRGENLSQMSARFSEKTFECGNFFPPLNSASSSAVPCGSSVSAGAGRRSSTAPPPHHRQHPPSLCTTYGARTSGPLMVPWFQGSLQCSDYCGNKEQWGAGQRLLWPVSV